MSLSSHIFTFCIIHNCVFSLHGAVEDNRFSDRNGRHLPTLLRYFQGFNSGQNYAQQFQPFYILPSVLVLPSINQHQNVIFQESSGQENYQEISKSLKLKSHSKLIPKANSIDTNETTNFNQNIFSNISNEENEDIQNNKLVQSDNDTASLLDMAITEQDLFTEPTTKVKDLHQLTRTDNNSSKILSLTNEQLNDYDEIVTLQSTTLQEDRVKKYWNSSEYIIPTANEKIDDQIKPAPTSVPLYPQTLYLPTDQDHDFLPKLDEKYHQFHIEKDDLLTSKGFKPLAGLYYDGFLHRPLIKVNGFKPI